jgi:hypothetical protein
MKTNRSYWQLISSSIAIILGLALVGCGGGGSSSSGTDPNTLSSISSFSIQGSTGTVNQSAKTIAVTLPFGTPVTALVASFTTTGSSVAVGVTPQVSGTTVNNFTAPVVYVVTAVNGTTTSYTVTVTVATNTSKALTSYSINGVPGVINEAGKTISVVLPFGTSLNPLTAIFTTTGTSIAIGVTPQVSGTTANNFTAPVVYVVTAANASTASYTVTVVAAANTAKALTSYSIGGVAGVINETAKTISVVLPSGTAVDPLIASFTTTGTGVAVGVTPQVSGTTPNDFTVPVVYVVTAGDASTQNYTVTVTVAATTSKALTSYSLSGISGVINETAKTVRVVLPSGSAVNALVASFATTGSSVAVGATPQVSGTTVNNFTNPVVYVVTAGDASTASYTVTVVVTASGPAPVALGNAGNYALFSNVALTADAGAVTRIIGDVGVGPGATSTAITTGFTPLTPDAGGTYATSSIVTGKVYAYDFTSPTAGYIVNSPTPDYVQSSSTDMDLAFNDAAGRTNPDGLDLGAGELGGLTLAPGLYKWTSGVNMAVNTSITLNGGPNDIWIMQVASALTTGADSKVILTGGAVPENVFWQIGTSLTVGATTGVPSGFTGIVLAGTTITIGNNATINGRLLAKTGITLDANAVTQPAN